VPFLLVVVAQQAVLALMALVVEVVAEQVVQRKAELVLLDNLWLDQICTALAQVVALITLTQVTQLTELLLQQIVVTADVQVMLALQMAALVVLVTV
jgi:hypothetical protein